MRKFVCATCGYEFALPYGGGSPGNQTRCPRCSGFVYRANPGLGRGARGGMGGRRGAGSAGGGWGGGDIEENPSPAAGRDNAKRRQKW